MRGFRTPPRSRPAQPAEEEQTPAKPPAPTCTLNPQGPAANPQPSHPMRQNPTIRKLRHHRDNYRPPKHLAALSQSGHQPPHRTKSVSSNDLWTRKHKTETDARLLNPAAPPPAPPAQPDPTTSPRGAHRGETGTTLLPGGNGCSAPDPGDHGWIQICANGGFGSRPNCVSAPQAPSRRNACVTLCFCSRLSSLDARTPTRSDMDTAIVTRSMLLVMAITARRPR